MLDTERAYWAGILDGEGCLGIGRRLGKYITPTVQVANTKYDLMVWIQQHLGGQIYPQNPRQNRQPCYLWTCAGQKAVRAIREAYPYLVIKREQADLLLAIPRFVARGRKAVMTAEDFSRNDQIVSKIRVLNRRGVA